jgi:phospholipase C
MPNLLSSINHIIVLMLENRSFDHMLGLLYSASGNVSSTGQPFEGLTGEESNPGTDGSAVPVFAIAPANPNAYFMPGADPGEGYSATNSQLFGSATAPDPPVATNNGFVTNFSYTLGWESTEGSVIAGTTASSIMGVFPPTMLPVLSGLA